MFVTCTLTVFPAPSVQAAPGDMDFEDGYYYIKIVKSGKYVGLQGSPSQPGSIPVVSSTPMKWRVSHRNGKIQLSPETSSLTMEVMDGSNNEWGAKVQIWTNDPGYSCKEIQAVSAGYGSVCLRFEHSGYVLDVKGGAIYTDGTPLWQYRCNGTDAQKFYLERVSGSYNNSSDVQRTIYEKCLATEGDGGWYYQNYYGISGQPWCVAYAVWALSTSMQENGYSRQQIQQAAPAIFSTTQLANFYSAKGRYQSFSSWRYNGIQMYSNSSNSSYTPKVGDLVMIDNEYDGIPNHTGIIISVGNNGFTTMEGNVSSRVARVTYTKYNNSWAHGSSVVKGICNTAL